MTDTKRIHQLLDQLYNICDEISQECDGRPCTPSGFCVGTPGEYLAAAAFGLRLLPGNSKDFDAETADGKPVQIRTSGKGNYIPIYGGEGLLLVVRLRRTTLELIYGGPACQAWRKARGPNHRSVHTISLAVLKELHAQLPPELQLQRIHEQADRKAPELS